MSFALGQQKMRSYIITIARATTSVLIIIAGWQLGQGLLVISHGAVPEGLARSLLAAGVIVVLLLGWRVATGAKHGLTTRRDDDSSNNGIQDKSLGGNPDV